MGSPLGRQASWQERAAGLWQRLGRPKRRTAFIFSGGGNLGSVQVGMLRALVEAGIEPDLIIGCSVGAINGAGFAAEPNSAGVDRLDRIWRRLADGDPDLMPSTFLPVVAQMARKGEALHDPERLASLLDDELQTKTFDGLRIPFSCVATDLETASEHWFDEGRIVPALLASAALPAVYPAVELAGRTLIDGGVLNEIHTARAIAMGATELYLLHVGHLEERQLDVQRPFDSAMRAYWIARRFRLDENLRRIPTHCVVHRLPAGSSPQLRFNDFTRAPELIDLAHKATLQYLRTGLAPTPVSGPVSEPEDEAEPADEHGADAELNGRVSSTEADADPDGSWPADAGNGRDDSAESASDDRPSGQRLTRAIARIGGLPGGRQGRGEGDTGDGAAESEGAEASAEGEEPGPTESAPTASAPNGNSLA